MSKRKAYTFAEPSKDGPRYWLGLEDFHDRRDEATIAEERAREFRLEEPAPVESASVGRRGFLGFATAALALAGAEGCRRPVEKIVPYAKMPENIIPGIPVSYATVTNRRGDAVGLLVTSHVGRPTKVEGNPDHPASMGGTDALTQASILDLYDPDRSTDPRRGGRITKWDEAERDLATRLTTLGDGTRLALLMEPTNSLTALRLREQIQQRFPKVQAYTWSAANDSNAREGAALAYGQRLVPLYDYDKAKVIVSLDCDFLQTEPGAVRANRSFAAGRRAESAATADPSRLYVVEPTLTTTGANADHRLRLPAARIEAYVVALIGALGSKHALPFGALASSAAKAAKPLEGVDAKWIDEVAKDLAKNRGKSIVVAGSRQPAVVHALAHAINDALGNVYNTVRLVPAVDSKEGDNVASIKALAERLQKGDVDTLIMLGGNPVYDAPADLKFGELLGRVGMSVHLSSHVDETSEKATWHLPRTHELEAWGDQVSLDGTLSVQQPLIAPLFDRRSDIEILALLAASPERKGHDLVRATLQGRMLASRGIHNVGSGEWRDAQNNLIPAPTKDLERDWKRSLRDGVVRRDPPPRIPYAIRAAEIAAELEKRGGPVAPLGKDNLEVVFLLDNKMMDGRHANNPWLLELPDPITKVVWDNVALLSPKTAKALDVKKGDLLRVSVGERTITIAAFVLPGQADFSIGLPLGWGRRLAGRLGNGKGFNVYPLRASDAAHFVAGAKVAKLDDTYFVGVTQDQGTMAGRPIAIETNLADYKQRPNFAELAVPPPRKLPLWKEQAYVQEQDAKQRTEAMEPLQWGMVIDLNACTGCNTCIVACQAENNIPVVGKLEVQRGREMQWIRVDRYFVADPQTDPDLEDPLVAHQPLMCVQCEEAPCENVCPVNATTHTPEGLNDMVYNRCIGTRYCANNCPYKVRRFNYLNWHNDSVWAKDGRIPETYEMQHNPNVTVRFRGVMEKCTYCVQRIQSRKIAARREKAAVGDGIMTACQQACPAGAIVFGNVADPMSRVSKAQRTDRRYDLLGEIGTKPRTKYLGRVRNPNPDMGSGAKTAAVEHGAAPGGAAKEHH